MTPRLAPKTLRVVCTRRFLTDQEEEGAGDPWAPPVPGGDSDPRHPPPPPLQPPRSLGTGGKRQARGLVWGPARLPLTTQGRRGLGERASEAGEGLTVDQRLRPL